MISEHDVMHLLEKHVKKPTKSEDFLLLTSIFLVPVGSGILPEHALAVHCYHAIAYLDTLIQQIINRQFVSLSRISPLDGVTVDTAWISCKQNLKRHLVYLLACFLVCSF